MKTRLRTWECPFCGSVYAPQNRNAHAASCLADPDVLARVAAALADPDRPGVALTQIAYREVAARDRLPERKTLTGKYGSWPATCRAFGLEPPQNHVVRSEPVAIAETEGALERDAALRDYWSGGRGFEVCSGRALPDGRTAWMLR